MSEQNSLRYRDEIRTRVSVGAAESLVIWRQIIVPFLVVLLDQFLRFLSLKLHKLYRVETLALVGQREVSCNTARHKVNSPSDITVNSWRVGASVQALEVPDLIKQVRILLADFRLWMHAELCGVRKVPPLRKDPQK